ncbi:MAG: PIN domain-containing protein [Acidobacteriia bacterium]|nr:PIN domain-containing protein [Terriglobia bacterium]
MPHYLADTSLIVDLINDRGDRRNFVRQLLKPGDTLGYCTINLIEVYTGMRPGEEEATAGFMVRLLYYDVTQEIAKLAGSLRYQWRRQGHTLSLADATIAAVALHHNLALLTDNRKHFPMPELALPPI